MTVTVSSASPGSDSPAPLLYLRLLNHLLVQQSAAPGLRPRPELTSSAIAGATPRQLWTIDLSVEATKKTTASVTGAIGTPLAFAAVEDYACSPPPFLAGAVFAVTLHFCLTSHYSRPFSIRVERSGVSPCP